MDENFGEDLQDEEVLLEVVDTGRAEQDRRESAWSQRNDVTLYFASAERRGIVWREFLIMTLSRRFAQSFIIAMALASAAAASAQTYPTRSLRLLLGLPPGGAADVTARLLAHGLEEKLGQPVVVENKPGSGGNLVGELVAKSPPDGYTLLLGPDSLFVINPHLYASMSFNPLKDLTPVASLVSNFYVFVVSNALPVKNLSDFVALAKRSNPPLFYASFGNGTQSHLGVEMLKQIAQFKLNHVPYRGGAQAAMAVASGDASLTLGGGGVYPMMQSGQLRPLAVASREPINELPGVPSVSEFYPSYALASWQGLFVPTGTPPPVIDRLRTATNEVISEKSFDAKLRATLSGKSYRSTPEEFSAQIKREYKKYGALIGTLGIKIQ
jgi:tripartite-type tricarboxylate transporter receptor subunit TctC